MLRCQIWHKALRTMNLHRLKDLQHNNNNNNNHHHVSKAPEALVVVELVAKCTGG